MHRARPPRDARVAHAEVAKVIVRVLPVTHPIHLGLALNFSRQGGGARTGVQLGSGDAVGNRRAARRIVTDVEQKVMTQGIEQQTTTYAREYVMRVETGIPEIRDGIFALMEKDLISSASVGEPKELIFKMKGVSRLLAELGKIHDETAGDVEVCCCGGDGGERSQGKDASAWAETGEPRAVSMGR